MEAPEQSLPLEWEERWRREKEKRKKGITDSEEGLERANRELKWIVASNDSRTGLRSRFTENQGAGVIKTGTNVEETTEHLIEESPEDEEPVQFYCSRSYPKAIFQVLGEFWRSSILTDLTLVVNNQSFQVHSVVLAAVSSFIQDSIKKQSHNHTNEHMKTVSLGPGVHHIGLQAVVEFAYTGSVCPLTDEGRALVKETAQALGVPRLLELCNKDKKVKEQEIQKNKEEDAEEDKEMKITLESIKDLWTERVGCDVTLDVDGASFNG